jgi:hypothetical protein
MGFRLFLAALAGGLAMFVWTSTAHVATPLGQMGMGSLKNDAAVRTALAQSQGNQGGLYMFPAYDPNAKDGNAEMARVTELSRTGPSGLILYRPAGQGVLMNLETMGSELLLEVIEAFMLVIVITQSTAFSLKSRLILSMVVGFAAALTTNGSQQVWYGFPSDYTRAQMIIDVLRFVIAGTAIHFVLPKRT